MKHTVLIALLSIGTATIGHAQIDLKKVDEIAKLISLSAKSFNELHKVSSETSKPGTFENVSTHHTLGQDLNNKMLKMVKDLREDIAQNRAADIKDKLDNLAKLTNLSKSAFDELYKLSSGDTQVSQHHLLYSDLALKILARIKSLRDSISE